MKSSLKDSGVMKVSGTKSRGKKEQKDHEVVITENVNKESDIFNMEIKKVDDNNRRSVRERRNKRIKTGPPSNIKYSETSGNRKDLTREDFLSLLQAGYDALKLVINDCVESVNDVTPKFISQGHLQKKRFPSEGDVHLLVTHSCLEMGGKIVQFLTTSPDYIRGIVGPSGLGKSYSVLYNYLQMRKDEEYVVLYLNNPEELVRDSMYIVKEVIFCFARLLQSFIREGKDSMRLKLKNLDYSTCIEIFDAKKLPFIRNSEALLRFLWAFYLVGSKRGMEMKTLRLVFSRLNDYCNLIEKKFLFIFDQRNVLHRPEEDFQQERKDWCPIFEGKKRYFWKILWIASQNNEFPNYGGNTIQWVDKYYQQEDLDAILDEYIDLECTEEKRKGIVEYILKKTKGIPIEVDYFLKTGGKNIESMWEIYHSRRTKELVKAFDEFQIDNVKFNPLMFFALLPFVDFKGEMEEPLKDGACSLAFKEGKIRRGCIDWNLFYYDEVKNKLFSSSPASSDFLRNVVKEKYARSIAEACENAFNDNEHGEKCRKGHFLEFSIIYRLKVQRFENYFEMTCVTKANVEKNVSFLLEYSEFLTPDHFINTLKIFKKSSENDDLDGSKEAPFRAMLLVPCASNFPLFDFFIYVPCYFKKGQKTDLLLQFQVTINIGKHKNVIKGGTVEEGKEESRKKTKRVLTDAAAMTNLVPKFVQYGIELDKMDNIKRQFVWISEDLSELYRIDNNSWLMCKDDFKPFFKTDIIKK